MASGVSKEQALLFADQALAAIRRRASLHPGRQQSNPDSVTPKEFEELIGSLLQRHGYTVTVTRFTKDGGVDIRIELQGWPFIVQCKHTDVVGRPHLQQFWGVIQDERVCGGIFVTSGTFTAGARAFVQNKPIKLWDRRHLATLGVSLPDPQS